MGYDVRLGDVFIFVNRNRNTMKLLHAEDGGLVLYLKRLENLVFSIDRNALFIVENTFYVSGGQFARRSR